MKEQAEDRVQSFCSEVFATSREVLAGSQNRVIVDYQIAGKAIRVHYQTQLLFERIDPAIRHLRSKSDPPHDLEIFLCDAAAGGVRQPNPHWTVTSEESKQSREVPSSPVDVETYYLDRGPVQGACIKSHSQLLLFDASSKEAAVWCEDATLSRGLENRPLRTIFQWFFRDSGRLVVHAAAVGSKQGGVLLTGRSGSGKSTAALACLGSPLGFAGDENVLLETRNLFVDSLYNSVDVDERSLKLLPKLEPVRPPAGNSSFDKEMLLLYPEFAGHLRNSFKLNAIVVPFIRPDSVTSLSQISRAEALLALAPTSLFQVPGKKRKGFLEMSEVIRRIPAYRLRLGQDLEQVPHVLARLLDEHRSASALKDQSAQ